MKISIDRIHFTKADECKTKFNFLFLGEWHAAQIPTNTDSLSTNSWNILGIVLLVVTIIAISVISFKFYGKYQKGRYNYKSKSKRFSEDASDEVRFLTADEQLDFTMQTEGSHSK